MATHNARTDEEVQAILSNLYSKQEFAKRFSRHPQTVGNWFREFGIKTPRKIHYKYAINNEFFKSWSKEMAWVLGFICADGCILLGPRNGGVLSIGVAEKDLEILEKINKALDSEYPIRKKLTNSQTYCYRLDISHRGIVDDLINLGVTPRKSKTLSWPDIPKDLVWHFIRGYYDGDGSIFYGKGYTNRKGISNLQLRTSVLGTKSFLQGILNEFQNIYPQYSPTIQDRSSAGYFRLEISGTRSAVALCGLLYKESDESTRLQRKYLNYTKFINTYEL